MADNFVTNPGAGGDTFAADDIAGVKWQRVKLALGADGSATDTLPTPANFTAVSPTGFPGSVLMTMANSGNIGVTKNAATQADGDSGNNTLASQGLYNNSTFDRQRGNTEGVLLASAARTAFTQSAEQVNYNARGVNVWVYVTAKAASTTLDLYIASFDPVSSIVTYEARVLGWVATANSGQSLQLYPGATTLAATTYGYQRIAREAGALSRRWYFQVVPSDANSVTYSAGYSYIV